MSLHNLAQQLAARGRSGDSVLVHMTPGEVGGLQAIAMAHGGSLTTNPDTGLPEANFLKAILPMLAGGALTAISGGALSPLMAAALVGGGTAMATKNLGQGLMAGLGAFGGAGLGGALAGLGGASSAGLAAAENGILGSTVGMGTGAGSAAVGGPAAAGELAAAYGAGPGLPSLAQTAGGAAPNAMGAGLTAAMRNPQALVAQLGGNKAALQTAGMAAAPALMGMGMGQGEMQGDSEENPHPMLAPASYGYAPRSRPSDVPSSRLQFAQGGIASLKNERVDEVPLAEIKDFRRADGEADMPNLRLVQRRGMDLLSKGKYPIKGLPYPYDLAVPGAVMQGMGGMTAWGAVSPEAERDVVFFDTTDAGPPKNVLWQHEVGHLLDKRGGMSVPGEWNKQFIANATALGLDPQKTMSSMQDKIAKKITAFEGSDVKPATLRAYRDPQHAFTYLSAHDDTGYDVAKTLGLTSAETKLFRAMTGLRRTRLDARDPDPYVVDSAANVAPAAEDKSMMSRIRRKIGLAQGGLASLESNPYYTMSGDSADAFKYLMGQRSTGRSAQEIEAAAIPRPTTVTGPQYQGLPQFTLDTLTRQFTPAGPQQSAAQDAPAPRAGDRMFSLQELDTGGAGGYAGGGRLLAGPGDGVSDSISATIDNRVPAKLATGEFVFDARTVSEIGNGDTKAGAKKLFAVMNAIHKKRASAQRGKPSGADRELARLA